MTLLPDLFQLEWFELHFLSSTCFSVIVLSLQWRNDINRICFRLHLWYSTGSLDELPYLLFWAPNESFMLNYRSISLYNMHVDGDKSMDVLTAVSYRADYRRGIFIFSVFAKSTSLSQSSYLSRHSLRYVRLVTSCQCRWKDIALWDRPSISCHVTRTGPSDAMQQ